MKTRHHDFSKKRIFGDSGKSRRNFLKAFGATALGSASLLLPLNSAAGRSSAAEVMRGAPSSLSEELYWFFVRTQFPLRSDLIYMNTGTEGSMPRFVLNNVKNDFADFAAFPMDAVLNDERCCLFMEAIKEKTAEFLGVDTDEIVMTTNTTEGLGFVANGLSLEAGDEVLMTTHFEPYNACWYFLRDKRNITITEVELPTPAQTAAEIVSAIENKITDKTKVISFCHINYTTGLRMPVKKICEIARDRGIITLVDGAHAIGMIDLDLADMGVDFYATSPHKWLCAPPGTGVLYIRKEMLEHISPVVSEQYLFAPGAAMDVAYFQFRGQMCTPAYAAIMDVMDFQNLIGKDKIEERILALSSYAKEKIVEEWGEGSLYSPVEEDLSSGLVSFNPFETHYGPKYGGEMACLFYNLWDKGIVTRSIAFKDKLTDTEYTRVLRLSTHIYNNFYQIDKAIAAVKNFIETI